MAVVTGTTVTIVGAGSAAIVASQPGNANWNPAPDVEQTLVVNKAPLTIQPAANQSRVYGAATPVLTYTASGWVHGDTDSLLTGLLGTTATAAAPSGPTRSRSAR